MSRLARAVALALGLACCPRLSAVSQVSPGPLARAHRELEGTLKCTQCHGAGKDAMGARCVTCHRDIAWLASRGRGFHGVGPTKTAPCASCHPDHAGVDFRLVNWPEGGPTRFDHRRTGWPLEQSHARLKCEQCHDPTFRTSQPARLAVGGKSNWTGLETACASCHQDEHRGALGERCTSCHDAGEWRRTPGFDHDTTGYRLAGKHREVQCNQCHASDRVPIKRDPKGNPIPVYRPVPHQTCASCHRDPHDGGFGGNCASCHSVEGFRQIGGGAGFDHGRTRFPLKGKHAAVKCAGCHQDFSSDRGRRPPASTCATCHRPDPHGGAATVQGKPEDCGACHSEAGFTPATFPIERHQTSRYPLEGRHLRVQCSACHRKDQLPAAAVRLGPTRVMIHPNAATCSSCHADQHGGQLASRADRADRADCVGCHTPGGWSPSGFDRAAHAKVRLPLDGRHAEIECRACHGSNRPGLRALPAGTNLGKAGFLFTGIESTCSGCHRDPHAGRFEPGGPRPAPNGCGDCHTAVAFRPAAVDPIVHQRFSFPLAGAHRAVPCQGCHREFAGTPKPKNSTLIASQATDPPSTFAVGGTCSECHRTIHGPQFDGRKGGAQCDACHGDESFVPASRFVHDRDTGFKLEGGHQKVPCGSCHRPGPGGMVTYRPLSAKCESCHRKG